MRDPHLGPEPPPPFEPGSVKSPVGKGCGRPLTIGCGLLALLAVVAVLLLNHYAYDILGWTLGAMRPEVERRLPEEATEADRQRLAAAFERAAARAEAAKVDPEALQKVQKRFIALAGKERMSREELEEFLSALEGFAEAPPPLPSPDR